MNQTIAMAKKPHKKTSHWASKEGIQQVRSVLTRETMKKLRQMNVKAPADAVTEAVTQAEATMPPGAFIVSASSQNSEVAQVKCKEG